MATLKVGDLAPDFTSRTEKGETFSLANLKGQPTVLYFYPKDNTPGCTRQACAFKNAYDGFKEKHVVVIGISKDSEKSHQNIPRCVAEKNATSADGIQWWRKPDWKPSWRAYDRFTM